MPRRRARTEPREPPEAPAALEIAARFLATRPRTRWEVARRLRRAGAGDAVVEATLRRLTELGYLDDAAFARWWSEQRDRHAPRGRRMLEAELRQHGVPREVIEASRHEAAAGDAAPGGAIADRAAADETQRARDALAAHLRGRPLPTDLKGLQRLGAFLMRRGFDPETVRSVLRSAAAEIPEYDA